MSFFPNLFHHQKEKSPASLKTQIDQVFDNFFTTAPMQSVFGNTASGFFSPAVDLAENKEGVELKVELPDMNKEDIQLELVGDHLVLSGEKTVERKEEEEKGYHLMERAFGSFRRMVPLPFAVDDTADVQATYDKGVLSVMIPRPANAPANRGKVKIN